MEGAPLLMFISENPGGLGTTDEAVAVTDEVAEDNADAAEAATADSGDALEDDDDPGITCWITRGRMAES